MPTPPRKNVLSDEELTSFEVSEDRRLREMGIDPNGNPILIMAEVRRRYELSEAEDRRIDEEERIAKEQRDKTP